MTRSSQKQDERKILDAYLEARGLTGVVCDGPDPPDFLVEIDGSVFGFEVTEYHQPQKTTSGHTLRQVEDAWGKLRQYEIGWREDQPELKNLNVLLNFADLRVPAGSEFQAFVTAAWAKIAEVRSLIGPEFTVIEIGSTDVPILRKYLRTIGVCAANCLMEWAWNYSVGSVGVSDEELLAIVKPKINSYCTRPDITSNRLIVAGFQSRLSQYAAPISAAQLNAFLQLNVALKAGPFDEVALLDIENFVWDKTHGWRKM